MKEIFQTTSKFLWPVKHTSQNQKENQSLAQESSDVVGDAGVIADISEILNFVVFVFVNYQIAEKFQVLRRLVKRCKL